MSQREIKFRVWNDDEYEDLLISPGVQLAPLIDWENSQDETDDANGVVCVAGRSLTHLVVEQFTGLRDKNNKEVYENDIVRFITKVELGDPEINIGQVTYDPTFAVFQLDKYGMTMLDGVVVRGSLEVIGNVHEDEGLLK